MFDVLYVTLQQPPGQIVEPYLTCTYTVASTLWTSASVEVLILSLYKALIM